MDMPTDRSDLGSPSLVLSSWGILDCAKPTVKPDHHSSTPVSLTHEHSAFKAQPFFLVLKVSIISTWKAQPNFKMSHSL